jgi:hypothetical protein
MSDRAANGQGIEKLVLSGGGVMLKYWSNIFGMMGVALIATAFFRPDDWQAGCFTGAVFIYLGAWFHGLSISTKEGKK